MSVENMRALTGIRRAEDGSAGELRVEITSQDHAYIRSLPKKFAYGTDVNVENIDPRDPTLLRDLSGFRIAPRFWSDDPGAKTCRIGPSVFCCPIAADTLRNTSSSSATRRPST